MALQPDVLGTATSCYLELTILFLCQGQTSSFTLAGEPNADPPFLFGPAVFLIRRCYDFAHSFHGQLSITRKALFLLIASLSISSVALGTASQYSVTQIGPL